MIEIRNVTHEQATKIMKKHFSEFGIDNWKIVRVSEGSFQFEKVTEYIKTMGICACHFDTKGNVYDYTITEIVIERYK